MIQEAWIGGVSIRRVDDLVQALGLSGISKSKVSKLCKDIDERVGEFLNRPPTGDWPYVWLDATYLKQRQGGRIVPVAAIIAVAANTEGRREIIGLGIGPSEAETFWTEFLRSLKARGLGGVKLVISDAHTGLKAAIGRVFEATWQRCRVHWMRNALAHVSRGQHTVVAAAIRQAFDQPDRKHAGETWRHVAEQLRTRWPKLADLMDASEHDVLAYMAFPRQHRTKLHSTNPIERLNKEVKRRADVVGIFPNEASIMRLIGAVLFEQNDEWQTSSRYMMVEAFAQIDTEEIDPISASRPKAAWIDALQPAGKYTSSTDVIQRRAENIPASRTQSGLALVIDDPQTWSSATRRNSRPRSRRSSTSQWGRRSPVATASSPTPRPPARPEPRKARSRKPSGRPR